MAEIGKISPIKRVYDKSAGASISASLADNGLTRWPTCSVGINPYKERDNSYRTGLDPEAYYIKQLDKQNPSEAKMERERVTKLLERAKDMAPEGLDLGPRSKFYADMYNDDLESKASPANMKDGENLYKLSDFDALITFAWLRVHPEIAPSYMAWQNNMASARCPQPNVCKFFVDDMEFEAEIAYKKKSVINKAIAKMEEMSPTKRLKVAKLLGLPVALDSTEELVYNELDAYITNQNVRGGTPQVKLFNEMAELSDQNLNLRYKIKQGLEYNYFRWEKNKIYLGKQPIAKNEDGLVDYLLDPKNQEDLLALDKNIKSQASQII